MEEHSRIYLILPVIAICGIGILIVTWLLYRNEK